MGVIRDILSIIQMVFGLLPIIMRAVKEIEVPGNGKHKLELVVNVLRESFKLIPPDVAKIVGLEKVEQFVVNAVGHVVAFFNKTGIFGIVGELEKLAPAPVASPLAPAPPLPPLPPKN